MSTASIEVTQTNVVSLSRGQKIVLDFDWSGNSVCGCGPDDAVPDIGDVRGWIEQPSGQAVRDLTPAELKALWNGAEGPVANAVYERIHEICQEGPAPDLDM